MGCSHLSLSAKKLPTEPPAGPPWICSVCKTDSSPWLCLCCGDVNCGRFVNGHGISHWKKQPDHCLVLDCQSLAVFCYECDDYVNEDTEERQIERLRDLISRIRPAPEETPSESGSGTSESTKTDLEELRECHSYAKSPLEAPELVCVSGNYLDDGLGTKRMLRPRKRTVSDSSSVENQEKKPKKDSSLRRSSRCTKKIDRKKAVGLRNLGNTCFMNAVLQSLSNIKEFCFYFKQLPALQKPKISGGSRNYSTRHSKSTNLDDNLMSEELRKILISLSQSDGKSAISPESLFNVIWEVVPRFRGYQQQDAHEFLRYMLDRLHTELMNLLPDIPEPVTFLSDEENPESPKSSGKSSIVTAIFGGTLLSEVRCLSCGTDSKKNDPFLDLSLDIPSQFLVSKKAKEESNRKDCKLSDCLLNFMEVEELGETELYNCAFCRSKQRSTKKFSVRRLPNVLCLHLKRFRWTNYLRTKIDVQIQFPLTGLDMSRYVPPEIRRSGSCSSANSSLFDLAAVVVHHGSGAGSGHYTAFASHDGNWYHFNDSTVKQTDEETVAKSKAYILFYVRREFQMP